MAEHKSIVISIAVIISSVLLLTFIATSPPRKAAKKPIKIVLRNPHQMLPSRGHLRPKIKKTTNTPPEAPELPVLKVVAKTPITTNPPPVSPPTPQPVPSDMVNRINQRLDGSPMSGLGATIVSIAGEYGLDPRLCVAIAMIESTQGRYMPGGQSSHNAWGMMGGTSPLGTNVGGWEYYPNWETAIRGHLEFIKRTWGGTSDPYKLRGYCAPDHPWMDKVSAQMNSI